MKISDILKRKGLFSKDIKQRFKNKQIKLNNIQTEDIDLNIKKLNFIDGGEFIFKLIKNNKKFSLQLQFFGLENILESNINSELKRKLDNIFAIRISKKELILIEKN